MASPAVTYTFSNGTTADATQVNTNFTDLINALTDGTKDLSISALTAAGTATLNGNVNLGNSTSDDLTITAALASTLNIKTTNSFDIGSATIGLRALYFGANSQTTKIVGSASMSATWTLTLPISAGTNYYYLQTDGNGASSWVLPRKAPGKGYNYSLACSVNASALTITLNGANASALSATNEAIFVFRNVTAATGTPIERTQTSSLTITVPSTAFLGLNAGGTPNYIWVYLHDNGGTLELGVMTRWRDDASVLTSTAISTSADDDAFYTTTGFSSKAALCIGRLKYTTAPAGTYSATPDEIALGDSSELKVTQILTAISSTKTPTASGNYQSMTGASLTLTPGMWRVYGSVAFDNNGTNPGYLTTGSDWCLANGADSATEPSTMTMYAGFHFALMVGPSASLNYQHAPTALYSCVCTTTIFLIPNAVISAFTFARIAAYPIAERVY